MRRLRGSLVAVALVAALAACDGGGGGAEPQRKVKSVQIANPFHERLLALDERMRRVGLLRAIRDTRNRCRSVVGSAYQQRHESLQMWVARCEDNRSWGVFIAPSGHVQVRSCEHLARLQLPRCQPVEARELPRLPEITDGSNR